MELRDKNGMTEKEFLEDYKTKKYPSPFLTADLVAFTPDRGKVLLVKRGGHPYLGHWACPGGFVNQNEDARTAAMRELMEETGLEISEEMIEDSGMFFGELGLFSKPGRDPRGWVVSDVYVAVLPNDYAGKKNTYADKKNTDVAESKDDTLDRETKGNSDVAEAKADILGAEPKGESFGVEVKGMDDAQDAQWFDISITEKGLVLSNEFDKIELGKEPCKMAFDHDEVLTRAIKMIGLI